MSFNKQEVIDRCNKMCANTLMETLKIEFIDAGKDFLTAKMPVNSNVHQPMGLLHGGATVALAESVGSAASIMYIDVTKEEVRGIEISANHLKSKRAGEVFATAKIIHKGRTIHIWEIRVVDENEELISLCKLMTMVLPLNK